jgi:transmembrane sensor
MNERLEQARQAARRITAGWQPADAEAQLARLHARRLRRARRWTVVGPLLAAAGAAAIAVGVMRPHSTTVPQRRDGTDAAIATRAPARDSAPTAPAPLAAIPAPPEPVAVATERGQVNARLVPEAHVIATGETRASGVAAHNGPAPVVRDSAPMGADEPPADPDPSAGWRDAAVRGDYATAWAALRTLRAPLDTMEDLLRAGDVARLSGHAGAAVTRLARAVELHPDDPRAPLAAFTLGRVHLEDLGAPRDAAIAFARARTLAPDGPLAEDALAREVEAWSRAGEIETARWRAQTYTQRYPQGRRVHAVRKFGGLESP